MDNFKLVVFVYKNDGELLQCRLWVFFWGICDCVTSVGIAHYASPCLGPPISEKVGWMLRLDADNASTSPSPSIWGGFADTGLSSEQPGVATQRAAKGCPQGSLPKFL